MGFGLYTMQFGIIEFTCFHAGQYINNNNLMLGYFNDCCCSCYASGQYNSIWCNWHSNAQGFSPFNGLNSKPSGTALNCRSTTKWIKLKNQSSVLVLLRLNARTTSLALNQMESNESMFCCRWERERPNWTTFGFIYVRFLHSYSIKFQTKTYILGQRTHAQTNIPYSFRCLFWNSSQWQLCNHERKKNKRYNLKL